MATHLLTGAGSGIGAALARTLLGRGDEVIAIARSAERAEDLRSDLPGAIAVIADLADPRAPESLAGLVPARLDSLVHAAGVVDLGPVATLGADVWTTQLTINLLAPAVLTRLALPSLRAAGGTVVFVNSSAGLSANPEWAAYAASKHGLRALADALRAEERSHGVRVTSIYPGRTATPMQERVHAQEGKPYDASAWIDPATVAEEIRRVLDLPMDATISDLTIRPR